jgi:hypothetical protein
MCAESPFARGVSFEGFNRLPAPVGRYLRASLAEGRPLVRIAHLRQVGRLRIGDTSERWFPFCADHRATPLSIGFTWDARVRLAPLIHADVRDSYEGGTGAGKVTLLSIIPLGRDRGGIELNSGALHRFLAEAVWYPTALLPGPGLSWSPIDDRKALATLTDHGISVSLQFHFNDADEVSAVYASERYRKTGRGYEPTAWEGHFRKYERRDGMRVPLEGEVGWYLSGQWRSAWQGRIVELSYQ